MTVNHWVAGSSPAAGAKSNKKGQHLQVLTLFCGCNNRFAGKKPK